MRLVALILTACAPVAAPLPDDPGPRLTLTPAPTLCSTDLLTGSAPDLAGTTPTATVLVGPLPSTFTVDVDPDGAFTIPRLALVEPVELLCPGPVDTPCDLTLTVGLDAVLDGELVTVREQLEVTLADDRIPRHPDADADGFGALTLRAACPDTPAFLDDDTDCDDTSARAHPGHERVHCDGLDNDCIDGEELVATFARIADGATPAEQLQDALDHVEEDDQVFLCHLEPFVGSFELDGRVRAIGSLDPEPAVMVAAGGPALSVTQGYLTASNIRFEGDAAVLRATSMEMLDVSIDGATRAVDVGSASFLSWRRGSCTTASDTCLSVGGEAELVAVDLLDNTGVDGGAVQVDGTLTWLDGRCEGNHAARGGCLWVGPAGVVVLGDVDKPVVLTGNTASDRGQQAFVQGSLTLVEGDVGNEPDDVVTDGGTRR